MSRSRWLLAIVVSLASIIPLHAASAQGPGMYGNVTGTGGAKQPSGMGTGGMFTGGFAAPGMPAPLPGVTGKSVIVVISNSPLSFMDATDRTNPEEVLLQIALLVNRQLGAEKPKLGQFGVYLIPVSPTRSGGFLMGINIWPTEKHSSEDLDKMAVLAETRLEESLRTIHETNMRSLRERLDHAERQLDRARAVVEERQSHVQSLRTALVQVDASPEGVDQQQSTLRADRLKLRVEVVGLKARREAIVRAIEEASRKAKATSEEQQRELGELQKIVEIRAAALSRAQQLAKTAAISTSDLQQAELELSRVRADLAERRRLIAAGSDQLTRLNQQLADVQIELSAAEARLVAIDGMLERLQSDKVLAMLREYAHATQQLDYARAEEKAAFEQVAEVKRVVESAAPPGVVEIRGPQGGNTKS